MKRKQKTSALRKLILVNYLACRECCDFSVKILENGEKESDVCDECRVRFNLMGWAARCLAVKNGMVKQEYKIKTKLGLNLNEPHGFNFFLLSNGTPVSASFLIFSREDFPKILEPIE